MCGAQAALTAALSEDGVIEGMGMPADTDPATVATMVGDQVGTMVSSGTFQIEGCSTAASAAPAPPAGASACGRAMPLSGVLAVVMAVLGQF